jgi:hypothetical protein
MKHTLWKVSNGYLRVPEGCEGILQASDAENCTIFKDLSEFAKWQPKRKRNRKPKQKDITNAN